MNPSDRARDLAGRRARRAGPDRRGALPGLAQRTAVLRARRRRAGHPAHPDRRADGRRSSPSGSPRAPTARSAVVTTSGTAAANLHPAVLEAAHAGVPLVAVTADRPARLRGTGANQTTDQVRLFGDAASFADLTAPDDDALDAAWLPDGPIHLNCQFDDPLLPPTPRSGVRGRHRSDPPSGARGLGLRPDERPHPLPPGPRTVVVAGDDAGPPARQLAEHGGLAAARRAQQRVAHRGEPDPHLPAAARHRPRRPGRARGRVRPPDPLPAGRAAAGPRGRRGRLGARPRSLARPARSRSRSEHDGGRAAAPPTTAPGWRSGATADRALSRRGSTRSSAAQPGLTPYDVAAAVNAPTRPAACCSSAPATRSATST